MSRDVITEPCLIGDMDEDWYHAGPVPESLGGSLSVSGAKKLLAPSCPAIFEYERRHPKPPTAHMEEGTIVHAMLLGTPQPAQVCDFRDWTTNKAKEAKAAARANGKIPVLPHKYAELESIAQAVLDDDECGALLAEGDREVSGFWQDPESGLWLRMRMDNYTAFGETPTIVDLKRTADSSPEEFARAVAEYRYDMQDWWYRDGLAHLLGCTPDEIDFVFVAVAASPPYLPMAYRLEDERDLANAEADCRRAREIYRDCTEANVWPKWSRDPYSLSLPGYARKKIEDSINDYYK